MNYDITIGGIPFASIKNAKKDYMAEFPPMKGSNVKLTMTKYHPTRGLTPAMTWAYGIRDLKVFRGGNRAVLTACSIGYESRSNRYKFN